MSSQQDEELNKQHRYPWPVIETAVKMYLTGDETYRSVSEKMLKSGVFVTHKTVFEWVQKFSEEVRVTHHRSSSKYYISESYVKCNNEWMFMYRAYNTKKVTLGVFLRLKRSIASAKSFFKKTLA